MTMTKPYLPVQVSKFQDAILSDKPATPVASRGNSLPRPGRSLRTPIRRFFFRLEALKSNASELGSKRSRVDEHDNDAGSALDPPVLTPPLSSDVATSPMTELDTPDAGRHTYNAQSPRLQYTPPVPCMALQNSDHSIDAVVISTLLKLPFCCHEDLLTMSPTRVVEVAQEMNERLPEVLKINLSEPHDHNGIRRGVERLVGIVRRINGVSVPGAPLKGTKSRGRRELGDVEFLGHLDLRAISPPTSPLALMSATRGRRRLGQGNFKAVMSPTKLAMLQEEDEDDHDETRDSATRMTLSGDAGAELDEDVFRAAKKRRTSVSAEVEMITSTMRHIKVPLMLTKLYDDVNDASPTRSRLVRDRSTPKIVFDNDCSAASPRSGKVIIKTTVIDRSLANTRPRYRSSSKFTRAQDVPRNDLFDGPLRTSTPKFAQIKRENRALGMKVISPIQKARRAKQGKVRDVWPDWSVESSRIPRYRRVNRSGYGRMSDFMVVDVNGQKGSDGNNTF